MGKVRMIFGVVILVILFVFALFNGSATSIQFFLKKWTLTNVPVWGVIYIALILGILVGLLLRGARKHKKKET